MYILSNFFDAQRSIIGREFCLLVSNRCLSKFSRTDNRIIGERFETRRNESWFLFFERFTQKIFTLYVFVSSWYKFDFQSSIYNTSNTRTRRIKAKIKSYHEESYNSNCNRTATANTVPRLLFTNEVKRSYRWFSIAICFVIATIQ